MPPSPSLRCSPGREPRTSHKKGRSLESGLSFREKDDDLALFNEMQSKEQENFLLQSTDDLEDILATKFKPLPDIKLGIMVPARGENSALLNVNEDKNDYDWLLTPPDTPLFPSLDAEQIPVNPVHSSRPRSQPITISRSSIRERSYNKRGSSSPQRFSPSPHSSPCSSVSSTFQSRGRPSAPHSSPTPSSRHSTPTRRPSPSPIKSSIPPRRSYTPTPRRSSTSGIRGASPIRASRGSSSSPKVRTWQSNIPGFSLEAPPNLCTSLADRPPSYVRGSSPASRNGRDTSSQVRRQSMSPTAIRSVSSSHSREQDWFNSHSKGSVASSGDDDADPFLSVPGDGSDHSLHRRGVGRFSNNRPISSSKKPSKIFSSSAPKRSFDTTIQHTDRKSSTNMFRPLLSSVPSTTFYGGKVSSSHRNMISMNSSVTTSTGASSDQAASGAPNTEGSEHNQDDVATESGRILNTDVNDEIFSFDKMDTASEDTGLEIHGIPDICYDEFHKASAFESKAGENEEFNCRNAADLNCSHPAVYAREGCAQAESSIHRLLCTTCGCSYNVTELVEYGISLCPDCKKKGITVESISFGIANVSHNSSTRSTKVSEEVTSSRASEPCLAAPEPFKVTDRGESEIDLRIIAGEEHERESRTTYEELGKGSCLDNSSAVSEGKASTYISSDVQVAGQLMTIPGPSAVGIHDINRFNDDPPSIIDVAEGAGISVLLLKRSSISKGPIIQGRSFTATAKSYDVGSCARELTSIRSSTGHGSASTSSSIDTSLTHAEMPTQRQLSSRRSDNSSNPEYLGSSFSLTSSHISQGLGPAASAHEENLDACLGSEVHSIEEPETSSELAVTSEKIQQLDTGSYLMLSGEDGYNRSSEEKDTPALELSINVLSDQSENRSSPSLVVDKEKKLHAIDDHLPKKVVSGDQEESAVTPEFSLTDESAASISGVEQMEALEASHDDLAEMSEIEIDNCRPGSLGSQNDMVNGDALHEPSAQPQEHKDASSSATKIIELEVANGMLEEHQEGRRTRSLTLEEVTDAILFCSSIVHNLACEAANIAIEKEEEKLLPLDVSRPTVKIVGRPSLSISKRTPKAKKERRRLEEAETNLHSSKTEAAEDGDDKDDDHKPAESTVRNVGLPPKLDSAKPPKLESKCNCTIM